MAATFPPPSSFASAQREIERGREALSEFARMVAGIDVATNTSVFYWSTPYTSYRPGQWYVAPIFQEPALSPRAVAQLNLLRARRWEVVLEPRALRDRAPRLTIAPRTIRAGRQPVSQAVRHVRQTRGR